MQSGALSIRAAFPGDANGGRADRVKNLHLLPLRCAIVAALLMLAFRARQLAPHAFRNAANERCVVWPNNTPARDQDGGCRNQRPAPLFHRLAEPPHLIP